MILTQGVLIFEVLGTQRSIPSVRHHGRSPLPGDPDMVNHPRTLAHDSEHGAWSFSKHAGVVWWQI